MDNQPGSFGDFYEDFNGGAQTSCADGFRFDKEPVAAQFSACQNVFEEYGCFNVNRNFRMPS